MTYRIGLTGNIGCGKSTVGRMLEDLGADYLDADAIVHELYEPGTQQTEQIVARFGQTILEHDRIDRRKLGEIVFRDPRALRDLESIIHPGVRQRIRARIAESSAPAIVVDAIKLLETGLADELDTVWVVTCPPELQRPRLMETRGLTASEADTRIDAQNPQEEKVRRAAVVIDNGGSIEDTRRQVERAWDRVTAKRSGRPTARAKD